MGAKSSQRQFLVKVSGIDGYFASKTGGNITAGTTKVFDGGSLTPDVLTGTPEVDDITVSRPYEYGRDHAVIKRLRNLVGSWTTTVSVTPTDRDLVALADPTVYSDALLVGLTDPDADAASADPATLELVFAISKHK